MLIDTTYSIYICLAAFICLLWVLRRDQKSLGLPVAYLIALLLIHVPGAFAYTIRDPLFERSDVIEIGIFLTAISSACFVAGVWLAHRSTRTTRIRPSEIRQKFWWFCLCGGWLFTYGLTPLAKIPSIGAAVEKGGAIWILGAMLGLRDASRRADLKWIGIWIGALMVYPTLMLLFGGFLSYGSTAIIIAVSALAVSARSRWRLTVGIAIATFVGLSVFVNYFGNRDTIRSVVWSGATLSDRIDVVVKTIGDFKWFEVSNALHLVALSERLNQNYFAGLAAERIDLGQADYLYGRSLWEGALSVVPRVLWPEKPVYGGSPEIVKEMTGLTLNEDTSWGVGNVMEFYINFGIPGLVAGFLLFGWLLGVLDRRASTAIERADPRTAILYFLPGAALIQPIGSLVELTGGAAAAVVAAYVWRWVWTIWVKRAYLPRIQSKGGRRPL